MPELIEAVRFIHLTRGQVAKVDATLFDQLNSHRWQARWNRCTKSFYAVRTLPRRDGKVTVLMHREVLGLSKGDTRDGDHKNGDTLDNRRANLRGSSRSQNGMNRGKQANNTSGFKGVSFHKATGKWSANIASQKKQVYLGLFQNPSDASRAYISATHRLHGEFARTI